MRTTGAAGGGVVAGGDPEIAAIAACIRVEDAEPLRGVFSTRSADRPNPIGVHRVTVVAHPEPLRFQVRNLEATETVVALEADLARR